MNKLKLLTCLTILIVASTLLATRSVQAQDETTDWSRILVSVSENPAFMGALMALVWNIGFYIAASARAKKLEPYDKTKLLETLALFETVFLIAGSLAGLPTSWVSALALALASVRSLKTAVGDFTAYLRSQTENKEEKATSPPS